MRKDAMDSDAIISALPLSGALRLEFIEAAKAAFERVMDRIEPEDPELTRALWDPAYYVDQHALEEGMLPIDRDYALSLFDAFLPHYVTSGRS